jgi:hypothetical protein
LVVGGGKNIQTLDGVPPWDNDLRDDVRRELLKASVDRRTVTYGFLMRKFRISRGAPRGKGMGIAGVIGEIDRHEAQMKAPGFAAIVVRKDTGYPGGGFFCWDGIPPALRRSKREGSNPRLSDAEKKYVRKLQEGIWGFYGGELLDPSAQGQRIP